MDDFERLAGLMGARRSTDPAPMPLSQEGIKAAFMAFDYLASDKETQIFVLKIMKAIEAYLKAAGDFHQKPTVQ
jgi:hypothetical protein